MTALLSLESMLAIPAETHSFLGGGGGGLYPFVSGDFGGGGGGGL
jgi:hypothetical protein